MNSRRPMPVASYQCTSAKTISPTGGRFLPCPCASASARDRIASASTQFHECPTQWLWSPHWRCRGEHGSAFAIVAKARDGAKSARRGRRLTVKLRGRPEAPTNGAEGAQFLSARGANPEARHGPLQRLLERKPLCHRLTRNCLKRLLRPTHRNVTTVFIEASRSDCAV